MAGTPPGLPASASSPTPPVALSPRAGPWLGSRRGASVSLRVTAHRGRPLTCSRSCNPADSAVELSGSGSRAGRQGTVARPARWAARGGRTRGGDCGGCPGERGAPPWLPFRTQAEGRCVRALGQSPDPGCIQSTLRGALSGRSPFTLPSSVDNNLGCVSRGETIYLAGALRQPKVGTLALLLTAWP